MLLLTMRRASSSVLINSHRQISVLFFGSELISKSCLKALQANQAASDSKIRVVDKLEVVCLPEKRKKLAVKQHALQHHIPVYTWPNLPMHNFDVGIIVSFGKLIPKDIIQSFKYGMINVHGSTLPRWRGAAPLMHTILARDNQAGVSIIEVSPERFDRGRILMTSEKVKVLEDWTSEDLGIALEDIASTCLLKCLGNIDYYLLNAKEQNDSLATYAPKINSEDSIIIWHLMDSEEVYCKYRAYGFRKDTILRTSFQGRLIKIQKIARLTEEELFIVDSLGNSAKNAVPGQIHFLKKSKTICVRCKSGYIGVKKLILGKPLTANDFYNGALQPALKIGKSVRFE